MQGDRSLERSAGGLGIGLTLVRKLTELHGGTVMARSEGPGKGSEFTVRFPAASETVSERVRAPRRSPNRRRDGLRASLSWTTTRTWPAGWRDFSRSTVMTCRSPTMGPPGVDKAKEWRPEFVLLDIGLPGMDGYQVAARLRQDPITKDVVIIAISGYGQEEDRNRSKQAGFDHHLVKPISSSDLIKVLDNPRRWLRVPPRLPLRRAGANCLTTCPSRRKTRFGQTFTRNERPSGRPGPSSILMWRIPG